MRDLVEDVERGAGLAWVEESPEAKLEIFPIDDFEPIHLKELFGNDWPIEVDLGSGSGKFLIGAAGALPERNFIGVERLLGRVRKTRRKALQAKLWNIRVLRMEIEHTLHFLIPNESISRFHLYFPDPWPKRRHHPRRVVDEEFLETIWHRLANKGEVWIKTDHQDYFERILKVSSMFATRFESLDWSPENYGTTDFEDLFLTKQLPIYRLRLRKRS
jgi:tRNA (guanine-N7-)-methyltransferase